MTSVISSSPRAEGFSAAAMSTHLVVVEVEPGHGVVRPRRGRLLLDGDRPAVGVELDDAVALRVLDGVGEDRRARGLRRGALQHVRGKPWP